MNVFKFRAWETTQNKMYYQVRCGGEFNGEPTAPTTWYNNEWTNLIGGKYTKIMQYTEYNDKDNVEIYGEDIIDIGMAFIVIRQSHFIEDVFRLKELIDNNAKIKVVGNTCQNKDLLDKIYEM